MHFNLHIPVPNLQEFQAVPEPCCVYANEITEACKVKSSNSGILKDQGS